MPLYFAYGSNMDRTAMLRRCPGSRPLGLAKFMRRRLVIMQEGYASIVRDPRASVHGVLFDLALSDVAALDRYEAVGRGLYAKMLQSVIRTPGGPVRALVYVGRSGEGGEPLRGYLEGVMAAGRQAGLPENYLQQVAMLSQPAVRMSSAAGLR